MCDPTGSTRGERRISRSADRWVSGSNGLQIVPGSKGSQALLPRPMNPTEAIAARSKFACYMWEGYTRHTGPEFGEGTQLNKLESHGGHTLLSKSLGHQHWVYISLGRSCAVASLLLPGLRGEENFWRQEGISGSPPGPYRSQADRWVVRHPVRTVVRPSPMSTPSHLHVETACVINSTWNTELGTETPNSSRATPDSMFLC